jgi:hypothetical protein
VLAGRRASAALVDRARAVLDTLTVEERPLPVASFTELPPGWCQFPSPRGTYAPSWDYRPDSAGWASSMPRNAIAIQA